MCKPHAWEECEEFQATFKAACIKSGGLLTFVDVVLYNVPGYGSEYFRQRGFPGELENFGSMDVEDSNGARS